MQEKIGVVIIGRNEGDRLVRCIRSAVSQSNQLIYVDSASTDNSVNVAREMGARIVSLDMAKPFTAARARNEGFERMRNLYPQAEYVQFVDGDCEIAESWLQNASDFLFLHHDVAVVCGRRRERYPQRSVYNMLCDIEWDTPVGDTKACGGDALMRVNAFENIGGFRASLIAGEEPELCVRLREAGWKIWRLDTEMTLHDAAITRFWQWWKRSVRSGYAFAEGAHLHGAPPELHRIKESRSVWIWGLGIPILTVYLVVFWGAMGLALLLMYPIQILRLAMRTTRSSKEKWWYALFLVLGKFPETIGQVNFLYNRLLGKASHIIEYK